MILAGDVGGTKCNLALFAEKNGKLEVVFRERFASKEFAQFDLSSSRNFPAAPLLISVRAQSVPPVLA